VSLEPRTPQRPLIWPGSVFDLQDALDDSAQPLYIVGGAVRDAFLRRPIKDIDLTTAGDAVALARTIADRLRGDFYVLDAERGVGRAIIESQNGRLLVDVSRMRGADLGDDLADRDFTVNAIAVDLHGDLNLLIDLLGGEDDLLAKRLRRCSPQALAKDPIRALRAVRQSVQFDLRIEKATLADVRAVADQLHIVSPERVRDEFFKLLESQRPAAALRVADALGLLDVITPEVAPLKGLGQDEAHAFDAWEHTLRVVEKLNGILTTIGPTRTDETAAVFEYGMVVMALDRYRAQLQTHLDRPWPNERSHRGLLLLAALLHDIGRPATAAVDEAGQPHFPGHAEMGAALADQRASALRLSNDERARLRALIRSHMHRLPWQRWDQTPTRRDLYRFWNDLGPAGVDVCLFVLADYLGARGSHLDQDVWIRLLERLRLILEAWFERRDEVVDPAPLVDGTLLMETLDLRPGRTVGAVLALIREGQAAGEIRTRDEAFAAARAYLSQ